MPTAKLSEVDIYYNRKGKGELSYVFCHGLGGNSIRFEKEEMEWYSEIFDVVSWDNRGLGRSGFSKKYSLPLYAKDLNDLLDLLSIDKAVIFGVSWGGVLTQRFAIDYPERCHAIILDSTSSEVNRVASERWYQRGQGAYHRDSTVEEDHRESYVAQCRAVAALREHSLTMALNKVNVPALIVGGGKDEVAGAAGSVVLSRNLPNSQLHIFQEAGHGTYSLEREGFRDLLLRFAESNSLL